MLLLNSDLQRQKTLALLVALAIVLPPDSLFSRDDEVKTAKLSGAVLDGGSGTGSSTSQASPRGEAPEHTFVTVEKSFHSATVRWQTKRPISTKMRVTNAAGESIPADDDLKPSSEHAVTLDGLEEGSSYTIEVLLLQDPLAQWSKKLTFQTSSIPRNSPCPQAYSAKADLPAVDEHWGEIKVGPPKVWEYERVHAFLDGVLRDIESVSIRPPTDLQPSAVNATALRFLESVFSASVSYDQKAAFDNRIAQENLSQTRSQQTQLMQLNQQRVSILVERRNNLDANLNQAIRERTDAQKDLDLARESGDQEKVKKAQDSVTSAQDKIDSINRDLKDTQAQITDASSSVSLVGGTAVSGTSAELPQDQLKPSGFPALLANLSDEQKKQIFQTFGGPSYPATQQMDIFLSTVYERMTRQLNALQDDVIRDPSIRAYLLEFDVGLYPSTKANNHVARVEFELPCRDCRVYTLFPGQSAYNLADFYGSSKKTSIYGAFSTLIGIGAKSQYQRQVDELHSGLVQSVYVSGFQQGNSFGWYYGPAPFEKTVTPGIHTTFAIVTMPKTSSDQSELSLMRWIDWVRRGNPGVKGDKQFAVPILNHKVLAAPFAGRRFLDQNVSPCGLDSGRMLTVQLPQRSKRDTDPNPRRLHVARMEYDTSYFKAGDENKDVDKRAVPLLIQLNKAIDPSLLVAVNGNLLPRVRDWRGRASSAAAAGQAATAAGTPSPFRDRRSLFETDLPGSDTWAEASSNTLLLNISQKIAGSEDFPVIQLVDPTETTTIPHDLSARESTLFVNGFRIEPSDDVPSSFPTATFLPLFSPEPDPADFSVSLEDGVKWLDLKLVRDSDAETENERKKIDWLPSRVQVIVEEDTHGDAWSLQCAPHLQDLRCKYPAEAIRNRKGKDGLFTDLQVWLEQTDPDRSRNSSFYSRAPVRLPEYPGVIEDAHQFRSFHFDHADEENVYVAGCNYPTGGDPEFWVTWTSKLNLQWGQKASSMPLQPGTVSKCQQKPRPSERNCACTVLPTEALDVEEVRLPVPISSEPERSITLQSESLKGTVGEPEVVANWERNQTARNTYTIASWDISIPVERLIASDRLFGDVFQKAGDGDCVVAPRCITYTFKSNAGKTVPDTVLIHVPHAPKSVSLLSNDVRIVRGSRRIVVGRISGLRKLLTPSGLQLLASTKTSFQLKGHNAASIDEVVLQGHGQVVPAQVTVVADDIVQCSVSFPSNKPVPGDYAVIAVSAGIPARIKDEKNANVMWTIPEADKGNSNAGDTGRQGTLKKDMTRDQVISAFGPPQIEAVDGKKTTLKYRNMTIELEDGKVKAWNLGGGS